jgi:hypothetical protein
MEEKSSIPLLDHVRQFCVKGSESITLASIKEGHAEVGMTGPAVKIKADAIQEIVTGRFEEPLVLQSFNNAPNPAATGIWRDNGTVNHDVLNEMIRQCSTLLKRKDEKRNEKQNKSPEEVHQVYVVRKPLVMALLRGQWHPRTNEVVAKAKVPLFGCPYLNITWKTVTTGSFDDVFKLYDAWHWTGREYEEVMTEAWFRLFYTHPKLFWERVKREPRPPKPC